jgi:hypothetical protein
MAVGEIFYLATAFFKGAFESMPDKRVIIDDQNLFSMHGTTTSFSAGIKLKI